MAESVCTCFVYGTLKRGQSNYALVAPYPHEVEVAATRGLLFDHGPFPALVAGEGEVRGELLRFAPADLATLLPLLDELEDFRPGDPAGSMYLRAIVDVGTPSGPARAYTYFYNRPVVGLRPLPDGEWRGPATAPSTDAAELAAFKAHVRGFLDEPT